MTTIKQLDKQASATFNNFMRRRGFGVEPGFCFWRKRGPLFDFLTPQILTGGTLLRINVTIWTPWIDNSDGEFETFPPTNLLIGGTLSEDFPDRMRSGDLYEIGSEAEIVNALRAVAFHFESKALKWFDSIDSSAAFLEYVGDKGFYPTEERAEVIRTGISRAFEMERFR
jgi:hypothetical protein